MVRLIPKPVSPQEYLELEQAAEVRHEFVDGVMYAMAGTSRTHNFIATNIFRHFANLADAKSCRVFHADMKLQIGSDFYYPDVMVVCAPEPENEYYETDPCILVEVLSESTKNTDLREKVVVYRQLKSLQTYLIVDPGSKTIRHYFRDPSGNWQHEDVSNSGTIPLPCLSGAIELDGVYRGVL